MKKKLLISCILITVVTGNCYGQFIGGYDSILQQKFYLQVKQLSQFFDRFNFIERLKFADSSKESHAKNIISLVNLSDKSLTSSTKTVEFLNYLIDDNPNTQINYHDSNWYAIVHSIFLLNDRKVPVNIVLVLEKTSGNCYSWVIKGIKSKFFHLNEKASKMRAFINPMNHEVGFTELNSALVGHDNITTYTSDVYHPDGLSAFLLLVQNGLLKLKQISSVDFELLQIPGWVLTVKDFNRAKFNSGWLIASIEKMDDEEKENYIKNSLTN